MKKVIFWAFILILVYSCQSQKSKEEQLSAFANEALEQSRNQLARALQNYKESTNYPRSVEDGEVVYTGPGSWTSGFFPGSLWLMYDYTGDDQWRNVAEKYTAGLEEQKNNTGTHDLGFMMYCSFGEGLRLTGNREYRDILIQAAKSLATRFDPKVGSIKSWDWSDQWEFPVIVDNMMNLELLFWASEVTGDSTFYDIAISHADKTIENHYRKDNSSYHVVNYDSTTGEVISRVTHQGYADESSWVRGQAWGLYGYVVCYEKTGKQRYLDQAQKIAGYYLNHPKLPGDMIPYWDFDVPSVSGREPRDVSAAAIVTSALLKFSKLVEGKESEKYFGTAIKTLKSLVSGEYFAKPGDNNYFLLKHSTGNLPGGSEIDVPLVYADYYFLESLMQLRSLNQ